MLPGQYRRSLPRLSAWIHFRCHTEYLCSKSGTIKRARMRFSIPEYCQVQPACRYLQQDPVRAGMLEKQLRLSMDRGRRGGELRPEEAAAINCKGLHRRYFRCDQSRFAGTRKSPGRTPWALPISVAQNIGIVYTFGGRRAAQFVSRS